MTSCMQPVTLILTVLFTLQESLYQLERCDWLILTVPCSSSDVRYFWFHLDIHGVWIFLKSCYLKNTTNHLSVYLQNIAKKKWMYIFEHCLYHASPKAIFFFSQVNWFLITPPTWRVAFNHPWSVICVLFLTHARTHTHTKQISHKSWHLIHNQPFSILSYHTDLLSFFGKGTGGLLWAMRKSRLSLL